MPLDDKESRRTSLSKYLNYKDWTPSPYISFTTCEGRVEDLARMRAYKRNRGVQTLTVISPDSRIRNGLPVLSVKAEMGHYGIQDPYGKSNKYYVDEYLCLWQVTSAEIVGHWEWDSLSDEQD